MTYPQAYAKAKSMSESTGEKYFVYRDKKKDGNFRTARATHRNWIDAIFSEMVFPNDGLVSTHTAQETVYAVMHGTVEESC